MSAILILMLVSLLVALGFLAAYIWAVRGGQYDDIETPSMRILMDEEPSQNPGDRDPRATVADGRSGAEQARPAGPGGASPR